MTPPRWRLAGAPSGTRSGDGRHRPTTTRVIVVGIGPPRPTVVTEGVRQPATPARSGRGRGGGTRPPGSRPRPRPRYRGSGRPPRRPRGDAIPSRPPPTRRSAPPSASLPPSDQ